MTHHYSNARPEDFDLYLDQTVPGWIRPADLRLVLAPYFSFVFLLRRAGVLCTSLQGGPLGRTLFWFLEAQILRFAGIKTVVLPYGGDGYMYSKIRDLSLRHGFLLNYPESAKRESEIEARVSYWTRHADVFLCGILVDGVGRWDVLMPCYLAIDTERWMSPGKVYSDADGSNAAVRVIHTPNHRGVKGTQFLLDAVDELKNEGLKVDLVLLEGKSNEQVREEMQRVDILAEHFLFSMYALSGVEGMAMGLPVLANLSNESYTQVFRRFSFLGECPIFSAAPENLKENLRVLIQSPLLRKQLGRAGRAYVEKYHSFAAAQYLFGSICRKLLDGEEVDLLRLFDPAFSSYVRDQPQVRHPLVENRLAAISK